MPTTARGEALERPGSRPVSHVVPPTTRSAGGGASPRAVHRADEHVGEVRAQSTQRRDLRLQAKAGVELQHAAAPKQSIENGSCSSYVAVNSAISSRSTVKISSSSSERCATPRSCASARRVSRS